MSAARSPVMRTAQRAVEESLAGSLVQVSDDRARIEQRPGAAAAVQFGRR